jgi:hypothetical protein
VADFCYPPLARKGIYALGVLDKCPLKPLDPGYIGPDLLRNTSVPETTFQPDFHSSFDTYLLVITNSS